MNALVLTVHSVTGHSLKTHLQQLRFSPVVTHFDIDHALVDLATTYYDLMIVDWNFPGRRALEVVRFIRSSEKRLFAPLIVIGEDLQPDDVLDILEVGANDILLKPVKADVLGEKIRHMLRLD